MEDARKEETVGAICGAVFAMHWIVLPVMVIVGMLLGWR
jgi:hypothetical protein